MRGFNGKKCNVSTVSWAGEFDYPRGLTSYVRKSIPCISGRPKLTTEQTLVSVHPTDAAVNVYSAEHGTRLGTFPGTDQCILTHLTSVEPLLT